MKAFLLWVIKNVRFVALIIGNYTWYMLYKNVALW